MNLTADQQTELAKFPAELRALVEAELVAGNSIASIESGFPAAPCGASIKLARAVHAERRVSTDAVSFYERNSSSYAGEFTTAQRHFFVLEPPLPPEPEPDMDAIRTALEAKATAAAAMPPSHGAPNPAPSSTSFGKPVPKPATDRPPRTLSNSEAANGWTRVLRFKDKRPPHELRSDLERELMTLFATNMESGQLLMTAAANINGARYQFEVRFISAAKQANHYTLRVAASWPHGGPAHQDYFRKSSDGWYQTWTWSLRAATTPKTKGDPSLYREHCQAALQAERALDSSAAVQRAIIDGVRRGGTFGNCHKEGGTNIFWQNGEFVRSDYGDDPGFWTYKDEAEFLDALRRFCHFDITRNDASRELTELDQWKLILRRMSFKASEGREAQRSESSGGSVLAGIVALLLLVSTGRPAWPFVAVRSPGTPPGTALRAPTQVLQLTSQLRSGGLTSPNTWIAAATPGDPESGFKPNFSLPRDFTGEEEVSLSLKA